MEHKGHLGWGSLGDQVSPVSTLGLTDTPLTGELLGWQRTVLPVVALPSSQTLRAHPPRMLAFDGGVGAELDVLQQT